MKEFGNEIFNILTANIQNIVGGLAILIIGWLAAVIISSLVSAVLRRTTLDERIALWIVGEEEKKINAERWVSRGVFYIIIIFILVAFFQFVGFTLTTEPLNKLLNPIFQFAPRILAAVILLLVAWIFANILKRILLRVLVATKLDEHVGARTGMEEKQRIPFSKTIAEASYWLIFFLFLPAVLSTLALEGLLVPVQKMFNVVLGFLPNLLSAALFVGLGWLLARIMQRIVTSLLSSLGAEQLSKKTGLAPILGSQGLSGIVGLIVYVLILIPVLVGGLNALKIDALTQPASEMLKTILNAFPSIFAAGLLLIIAWVVARIVARLITDLLTGIGFNSILVRLGVEKELTEKKKTLSNIIGYIVLLAIMLVAVVEASSLLGFDQLADLIAQFMFLMGRIIFGLTIFAIGLYAASLASTTILSTGKVQANFLALTARISIIVVTAAISLRQMGVANEIINLAFGLLLGAIAIAVAIAFGVGGQDIATRQLEEWIKSIKRNTSHTEKKK